MNGNSRITWRAFAAPTALAMLAIETGCPGSLDPSFFQGSSASVGESNVGDAGAAANACPDVPSTTFAGNCALSGCHSAMAPQAGLDLASPDVPLRLISKPGSQGGLLIDPNDPSMSVLYTKLGATPPYGSRMPFGGAPLQADQIACVLSWIESVTSAGGDAGPTTSPGSPVSTTDGGGTPPVATGGDGGGSSEDTGTGGNGFTPNSLSNVVLWLDAAKDVSTSGSQVTGWKDQSSSHNDATGKSNAPSLLAKSINNLPALHFESANGGQLVSIKDSSSLQWGTGGFLIALVARDSKNIGNGVNQGHGQGVSTAFAKVQTGKAATEITVHLNWFTSENTDDNGAFQFGVGEGNPGVQSSLGTYNDGTPRLYVSRLTSNGGGFDMEIRVNGSQVGTMHSGSAIDVTLSGQPIQIGSSYSQGVQGEIAEVLALKGAVADNDLSRLENYLKSKYALGN